MRALDAKLNIEDIMNSPKDCKNIDFEPVDGFKNAESIRQVLNSINWMEIEWSKCGNRSPEFNLSALPSRLVIGALLCEIYLKTLCKLTNKPVRDSHQILKLFQSLNGKDQNAITKKHGELQDILIERIKNSPVPNVFIKKTVHQTLKSHNNSFIHWRYTHEKKNKWEDIEGSLELVADAIRAQILSHKPDWSGLMLHDGWRTKLGNKEKPSFQQETDFLYFPTIFQNMKPSGI
jgi:hypothetical protein